MSTELAALRLGASPEVALAAEQACIRFGIKTALQKAHFLGNLKVESANFTRTRENLNYSAKRLAEVWKHRYAVNPEAPEKKRMPNALALQIGNSPRLIANATYGDRMGNRPGTDDGWVFIGRGFKQLTGRDNYTRYSVETYGDLHIVEDPSLVERLPDAMLSAGWFWKANNINPHADRDDVEDVTRIINGGQNGIEERRTATALAKRLFEEMRHA